MSLRLRLACLPLLAVLGSACGGQTVDASPTGSPSTPSDPATATGTLFPASKGDARYIVAARPDTGDVRAFGPALPVEGTAWDWNDVHVSADGQRVAALFTPKSAGDELADGVLVVGGEAGWTTVDRAAGQLLSASDDLSLLVVGHVCADPSAGVFPVVLRADGTTVFQADTCAPNGPRTSIAALAPDGSYFVTRTQAAPQPGGGDASAELTLHELDGRQAVLSQAAETTILRAFPTSLLLGGDPTGARWVDTEAAPVDVPGWSSAALLQSGDAIVDGVIYRVGDRTLTRLLDVPPGVDPTFIVDVRGDFVITTAPVLRYQVTDAHGAIVAEYTPKAATSAAPTSPEGKTELNVSMPAESGTAKSAWYLLDDQYEWMTSTDALTYEAAEEVWLFVDHGGAPTSRVHELRRAVVSPAASQGPAIERAYASSADGAYLFYVEGAALHAVDTDSGADRALDSPFQIDSAGGSIHRHVAGD